MLIRKVALYKRITPGIICPAGREIDKSPTASHTHKKSLIRKKREEGDIERMYEAYYEAAHVWGARDYYLKFW